MDEYVVVKSPVAALAEAGVHKRFLNIAIASDNEHGPSFLYPAKDCAYENVHASREEIDAIRATLNRPKKLLGEWRSTAISGNDLLGSCLYSAGLVAAAAGYLAPIGFILVSVVLYVFRFIYEEVVTAFPLNGGSYNCLLNTSSKRFAAVAACMSILSYLATAVVSSTSAAYYFQSQFPDLPVLGTSVGILGLFGVLNIIGIGESAVVALIIFSFHVVTLTVLIVTSAIYMFQNLDILKDNFHQPLPNVDFAGNTITGNVATALFFGFSSAMLGVTGFETSSNFVENQQPGVFRKTMRNMWAFASMYNPLLSLLSLGVLPLNDLLAHQSIVLAQMGLVAGGKWLQLWVAVDALVVLAAGVLTSYVGITGLVRRLSNDRVVPAFLAAENQWRGTPHWISILFFVVGASLVLVLDANATILGGVFTFAFLSMMFLFGAGCITLKLKRQDIPRAVQAPWWACILGLTMVVIGYFCQLLGNPQVLLYFFLYLFVIVCVVFGMIERVAVLRLCIFVVNVVCGKAPAPATELDEGNQNKVRFFEHENKRVAQLAQAIKSMNESPMIFFVKAPNLTTMNKAIMYVRRNEVTQHLRLVHVYAEATDETMAAIQEMRDMVTLFDSMYPKLKLDFLSVIGTFEPAMVQWISNEYNVPTNMMFIKQPSNLAAHKVSSRGVRVITG
ncbi:transmembrane protein [Achlya hypogyna]|uniref:Transmembrane protein n=1 Tax=Achlya hypogyna TaxID=1202772 RepID=A0A1V9ZI70_ACHHY|nr:transmembrane protein [Achlya hypogyna]